LNIKELIREARLNKKLTLVELADLIGSTHSAISAWENGRSEPAPKYQMKLKEVLGIDFNDTLQEPAATYQKAGSFDNLSAAHKDLAASHMGLTEAMQEMVSIHKELIRNNTELTRKLLELMGTKGE
jgi:transcriptional regulator with XRE-family HTH domain